MKILKNILGGKKSRKKSVVIVFYSITTFFLLLIFFYNIYFWGLIFPNVYIGGIPVSGKYPQAAAEELSKKITVPEKILIVGGGQTFELATEEVDLKYDFLKSTWYAHDFVRTGNFIYDFWKRISLLFYPENLGIRLNLDEEKLEEAVAVIAGQITIDPVYPSAKLVGKEIVVSVGSPGITLNTRLLKAEIGKALAYASGGPISLPLNSIDPSLSEEEAKIFEARAKKLIGKSLVIMFEDQTFVYKDSSLFKFLDPKNEYVEALLEITVEEIASQINREPQEPVFVFLPSLEGKEGRVKEFIPAKDGLLVKKDFLKDMIRGNLRTLETSDEKILSFDVPVEKMAPKIQTGDINNLGIKELIGRGSSRFVGSIPNRIYNINLASSRFKGVLIKPGEIFSFNKTLGDVSVFTGYKQAYIIKDGKTILGDGGGVCQVSTTLFRAALNAGLPIIERRAHSYRVGYYEQDSPPGIDATVYAPTTDLKFKNDTDSYLLIQPVIDTRKATLVFEIYGSKDGRVATVSKPVVTDIVPPPEDLFIEDPSLPLGTIKQVEYKAWGAKTTFNYKVERDGKILFQKAFVSNYQPWQAVFLRGTGPTK